MNVSVKFETETRVFEVPAPSTIGALMDLLADSFGLPVQNQRIIFRGQKLTDRDSLLSDAGLKPNSRLLLIGSIPSLDTPHTIPSFASSGFGDFSGRQSLLLNDEYLTVPPHSYIIRKGPPNGAIEGSNYQLDTLPAESLIVRDSIGDEAKLAFRSDDVVVESYQSQNRLFYQEITSFRIQSIPGYEAKYVAVVFHIQGKKLSVYFVPAQYRGVIEAILQPRRG
jgi:hypothetical protein